MSALHEAGLDQADERGMQCLRDFQIAARRRTVLLAVDDLQIRTAAEAKNRVSLVHRIAEQDDGVAFVLEPLRGDVLQFSDEADDGNRGRRINRAGGALIVERAIAAGDGRVEGFATFRQTAHGFLNLPEQLRLERAGRFDGDVFFPIEPQSWLWRAAGSRRKSRGDPREHDFSGRRLSDGALGV